MKKTVTSFSLDYILTAIAFILIGILFLAAPNVSGKIVCYIFGGILCVIGIVNVISYFTTPVKLTELYCKMRPIFNRGLSVRHFMAIFHKKFRQHHKKTESERTPFFVQLRSSSPTASLKVGCGRITGESCASVRPLTMADANSPIISVARSQSIWAPRTTPVSASAVTEM